jgi:hypothetical protein
MASRSERYTKSAYRNLCYHIGQVATTWQHVEEAHFRLFNRLFLIGRWDVCATIYFSINNFEQRCTIMERLCELLLTSESKRKWKPLKLLIRDTVKLRNHLAHYGIEYEISQNATHWTPSLKASPYNIVQRENKQIKIKALKRYARRFQTLERRLVAFSNKLTFRKVRQKPNVPQILGPPPRWVRGPHHYFLNKTAKRPPTSVR